MAKTAFSQISDSSLIEQVGRRNESALAAAYDRFAPLIYSIAHHITDDRAEAEEIVGDVFVQVWNSAGAFDSSRGNAAAWLSVITRSRALDKLRARKRRTRLVDGLVAGEDWKEGAATSTSNPALSAETAELRAKVKHCLDELSADQRRAVDLAYYGALSHSEISEALAEPLGTIKTRIRAAMSKLKTCLQAYS